MSDKCHIDYEIFNTKCLTVSENSGNVPCLSFVYPLIYNHTDFCFLSVVFNDTFNCYDNMALVADECDMDMNVSGMIVIVENQSTGRKPSTTFSSTNPICNGLSLNLDLHDERLSHVIAAVTYHQFIYIYHARIPLWKTSRNHW